MEFFSRLKINKLQRLSKIIGKKVVQGIASFKKGCKFAPSYKPIKTSTQ